MTDDVVVVGGGIEGYCAALSAASERPAASVRLLVDDQGRFRHETGLLDVLGYTPDGEGPVREPFAALSELPAEHPYSRVGIEGVRSGLSLFADVTGYAGTDSDANALVATPNGNVKPTQLYPEGVASGLASDDREMLLVDLPQIADLDAELAAAKLDSRLPYDVRSTTITLDVDIEDHPAVGFAAALDEGVELEEELPVRRALAARTRNALDVEPRVGFPAVLGRTEHDEIRSDLETILQADVFEVPLGPPSVPGMRLRSRLRSALDDAGVTVETGVTVTDVEARDGRIERVHAVADGAGDTTDTDATDAFDASQYVLATGGLAAGGLDSDRGSIAEPTVGCHVPHPTDRADWTAEEFLGDQPFARVGLDVDDQLRPQSADGSPAFENLRAAGRILGGGDFAAEQSGGGIAVATGYRAGQLASEQ